MYKKELEGITPCELDEIEELAEALAMGDASVRNRLIEGNLERVIQLAKIIQRAVCRFQIWYKKEIWR